MTVDGEDLVPVDGGEMSQSPADGSGQSFVAPTLDRAVVAGTEVTVVDEDGEQVAAYTPTEDISCFVLSSAALEDGATHTLVADGSELAAVAAGEVLAGFGRGGHGNESAGERSAFDGARPDPST